MIAFVSRAKAAYQHINIYEEELIMKKSSFITLILGVIGGVFFSLGICIAMLPEWDMFNQGVICGVIGLVILLADLLIWRKLTGKAPIKLNGKTVLSVVVGVLGALLLGVGMCLTMVFGQMIAGVIVGLIGIVVLLLLIPLVKGIHD